MNNAKIMRYVTLATVLVLPQMGQAFLNTALEDAKKEVEEKQKPADIHNSNTSDSNCRVKRDNAPANYGTLVRVLR